jgi:hypothetical protein
MLHVRILTEKNTLQTVALVDSGSTTTFVPTDMAEILGLTVDPSKSDTAIGAGGEFRTIKFDLTIQLLKGGIAFDEFKDWPVTVPVNREAIPYVVLGRDSVFLRYDVTFRERQRRTILRASKGKIKVSRYEKRY